MTTQKSDIMDIFVSFCMNAPHKCVYASMCMSDMACLLYDIITINFLFLNNIYLTVSNVFIPSDQLVYHAPSYPQSEPIQRL